MDAPPNRIRSLSATVACVLLLGNTGCVQRSLTIRTDPPAALVYVNDQLKGESPMTFDFVWYGWYRVTLRKDGFDRLDDHRFMRAPFYLWIPLDLVMELLPFTVRDERTWSYTLNPSEASPTPIPPQIKKLNSPTQSPPEVPLAGVSSQPEDIVKEASAEALESNDVTR